MVLKFLPKEAKKVFKPMNNLIAEIQSYPFERLRKLITPKKAPEEINLSIGEPKHPASQKILDAIKSILFSGKEAMFIRPSGIKYIPFCFLNVIIPSSEIGKSENIQF